MRRKINENERLSTILTVARLYYVDHLSKLDISHEIKSSTTQVARLLEEAEQRGFVQVVFTPPKLDELAVQLEKKFPWLREVFVIPYSDDYEFLRSLMGKVCADYFQENVKDGMTVAVSGGDIVFEMVMALADKQRKITITPAAIVDSGPVIKHIDPVVTSSLLWAKSGKRASTAYMATGLPPDKLMTRKDIKKEYEAFGKRKAVQDTMAEAERADFIFASLGNLKKSGEQPSPYIFDFPLESLKTTEVALEKEGVVGDINYSFFDSNGNTKQEWNVFPTLGVEYLKKAISTDKRVIVTASRFKLPALKAALQGKLFNVLITDEEVAQELLSVE